MYRLISELRDHFRQRWFVVLFLLTLVPIFPEYISFFLTIAAFMLSLKLRPERSLRQRLSLTGGLIALFIVYMALSALYSSVPLYSLATAAMWLVMALGYLALTNVLTSVRRIHSLFHLISLVAGVLGLLALCQALAYHVFHWDVAPRFWDFLDLFIYQFFPWRLELLRGQHRSAATFNNPNLFCQYLSMVMPVVLFTLQKELKKNSRRSRIYILTAIFAGGGVIVSMSRGGYLALLITLLLFLSRHPQRVLYIGMIILLGLLMLPSSVINELFAFSSAHGDLRERAKAWSACLQAFSASPILGYGAGCGTVQNILAASGIYVPHAHNLILEIATEGGLIALLLLAALELYILGGGFRLLSYPSSQGVGIVFIAFIAAFFLHGLVDYPISTPKLVHCFLMMIGLFESDRRLHEVRV